MKLYGEKLSLSLNEMGEVTNINIVNDPYNMNWVITEAYLNQVGFKGKDKLFGNFELILNNQTYYSKDVKPEIICAENSINYCFSYESFDVKTSYFMEDEKIDFQVEFINKEGKELEIQTFGVWISFAYIMFQDTNVKKNIFESAAVFPSISKDYTKLAIMRRSQQESSLGMYQLKGNTKSIGTYCEFNNRFFEDVSPSLDGLLYHQLILSGGYPNGGGEEDWIYNKNHIKIKSQTNIIWKYTIQIVKDQEDFYEQAKRLGHPKLSAPMLVELNKPFKIDADIDTTKKIVIRWKDDKGIQSQKVKLENKQYQFSPCKLGEHQIIMVDSQGKEEQLIINVMKDIKTLIENRVDYICDVLYQDENTANPHAFLPISNQGESLGKLSLVLQKNLITKPDKKQIQKIEASLLHYVLPKWFENGNFKKIKKVYGNFYRIMDFEYLGHLLFLLAQFSDDSLTYHPASVYLDWATEVVDIRINPARHTEQRAKEESKMLGVFFLYINDLLNLLKEKQHPKYMTIKQLWEENIIKVVKEADTYKAAITEHYFDNAGFGPATGALAKAGEKLAAEKYGDLLLANIGFSNDFRAQNPDRWWEALTYMIHSLWGGVSAAASLDAYHSIRDPRLLQASYRAYIGILYCYDENATTNIKLECGQAASTYAVAGPHLNRSDLSRSRFGQDTFAKDGEIFAKLFPQESRVNSIDWDMGEELVTYLVRFGQDAYCYFDELTNELIGVNATVQLEKEGYIISNLAPYPRNIYIQENNEIKIFNQKEVYYSNKKALMV